MQCAVRRRALRRPPAGITSARRAACRSSPATTWSGRAAWSRESLTGRVPTMWRYREMLPLFPASRRSRSARASRRCCTPRGSARRSACAHLFVKDESFNPTNSFKARGQSTAVTRARALGATDDHAADRRQRRQRRRAPTPRPPACAARCSCRGTPSSRSSTSAASTAPKRHAGRRPDHRRRPAGRPSRPRSHGWYDVSTLKEPYRVEGKKTMGYELAEQLDVDAARLDHLSDRRRHRHGRHVEGVRRDGGARLDRRRSARRWSRCSPPAARRSSAPSRKAPNGPRCGRHPDTEAHGLRVPQGHRRLPGAARHPRERRHGARRHRPQMVEDMIADRPARGHLGGAGRRGGAVGRPGAASPRAASSRTRRVVLFNTGGALKYLEVLRTVR